MLTTGCGGGDALYVNDTGDSGDDNPGDGICRTSLISPNCTLRAAIEEANAHSGPDRINFALPAGDLTIRPQNALPVLTGELTIDGTMQSGYVEDPIIIIDGSDVELPSFVNGLETAAGSDVTIRGLQVVHFSENGILARGPLELEHVFSGYNRESGLHASGDPTPFAVDISESEFTGNTQQGIATGSIYLMIDRSRIAGNDNGGMSVADGSLVLKVGTIEDNYSYTTGGGISLFGSVDADFGSVEILNNGATDVGGGLYLHDDGGAQLTLDDCIISGNESSVGGGLYIQGGEVLLTHDSVINDNRANSGGGGIYINGGTVEVEMSTIGETGHGNDPDADHDGFGSGGGIFNNGGDLDMLGSSISGNLGSGIYSLGGTIVLAVVEVDENGWHGVETYADGAMMDLAISMSRVNNNAMNGVFATDTHLTSVDNWFHLNGAQGIRMERGQIWVSRSTLSENRGGGMYLNQVPLAEIDQSTIWGNTASGSGGGINMVGDPASILRMENVTIHENRAGPTGGGLEVEGGTAFLNNATISENTAREGGGIHSTGTVNINNTILDENPGGNCSGTITSLGYNIDHSTTCPLYTPGDQTNTAITLGPLQDNGGPTFTRAITSISPAFDAGNDATCAAIDQRTVIRPQAMHCDIGAFELEARGKPGSTTVTPSPTPDITPTLTPTSAAILFEPVEFSPDKIFQGGKTCEPMSLTVKVRVSPADLVHSLALYYRVVNKDGTGASPWDGGLKMERLGDGWYQLILSGNDLPKISTGHTEAWLDIQFVANDSNYLPIARSAVLRQVTLQRCFN
jgi:CSLREA domain-containing protein